MKLRDNKIALKHGASLLTFWFIFIATPVVAVVPPAQDDIEQRVLALKSQDIPALHQRAVSGEAMAQYMFGRALHLGWQLAKDKSQAADWYQQAADQGYGPAQLMLFEMYSEGEGVSKNPQTALKWLRKAAEGGFASGQFSLGLFLQGQDKYSEAAQWFRRAAEKGLTSAQNAIGFLYEQGLGVSQDFRQAVSWYRKAAENGDATAQSNLGDMYSFGKGTKKDPTEAAKWFLKSAEQGWPDGQLNLAGLYIEGSGVPKDLISAYMWASIAGGQGNVSTQRLPDPADTAKQAMQLLAAHMTKEQVNEAERRALTWNKSHASSTTYKKVGNTIYIKSESVPNDVAEDLKKYQTAAEQGEANAQSVVGEFYYRAHRYEEALTWFRKSADQGYAYGQYNLGVAYMEGSGVPRDEGEAIKWFLKASEQGLSEAMTNLTMLYYIGRGVAKDLPSAYMWLSLAAAAGDESAQKNLGALKEQLTSAELKEAERREAAWRAQHPKQRQKQKCPQWLLSSVHTDPTPG